MSRSSYTASERRGILAIAIIALLIIGSGVFFTHLEREKNSGRQVPVVVEHPELKDTVKEKENKSIQKKSKKKKNKRSKDSKNKKTYRKRNPLEEPV